MRIALILPPARHVDFAEFCPLGVGIIAARLEELGHKVSIIDSCAWGQIKFWRMLDDVEADVVGIGGTIVQLRTMVMAARIVRKSNPNAWLFFAGRGVFSIKGEILLQDADAILMGEGEDAIPTLVENGMPFQEASFPPGWIWKDNGGLIRSSGNAPLVDVVKQPFPAWDLYPLENYLDFAKSTRGYATAHIMASRGCIHHCTFCDRKMSDGGVRRRPVEHVVGEMTEMADRYSAHDLKEFYFFDPSFMSSREWLEQLYKELADLGRFNWGCLARVDDIEKEMLLRAKEAGCSYMNFGVETGSDKILKDLAKGVTTDQIKESFSLCHKNGIKPGALLLIGLPQETPDDIYALKRLLKSIRPTFINISIVCPFPNTTIAKQFKDDILPVDAFGYCDYFPERTMFKNLKIDTTNTFKEIARFYIEEVNPGGYVNQITFLG